MTRVDLLLVEDDALTAFNTKRSMRQCSDVAAITVVQDGREALDLLRSGEIDCSRLVILTDLSMPRMSGLELAAAIRAEPTLRDLPIHILTTSTSDADRQAAVALDVAGYHVKSQACPQLEAMKVWLHGYVAAAALEPAND